MRPSEVTRIIGDGGVAAMQPFCGAVRHGEAAGFAAAIFREGLGNADLSVRVEAMGEMGQRLWIVIGLGARGRTLVEEAGLME